MEVYILDSIFRREQVVDTFESFIWTERWAQYGDFEMHIPSTLANRNRFIPGTFLAMNESYRVMIVETVENAKDDEGRLSLVVKGRSLESIFDSRVVMNGFFAFGSDGKYQIQGLPIAVIQGMFKNICVNGDLDPGDKLPFIQPGSLFPKGTIPEPTTYVDWNESAGSMYETMKSIAESYGVGFRLVRNFDKSELYFDAYTGNDRTSAQTTFTPVIFSTGSDNLHNTTELTSIEDYKNIVYIQNGQSALEVYEDNYLGKLLPTGFDRRVLYMQADDLPQEMNNGTGPTTAEVNDMLFRKGQAELAKHHISSLFDGELSQTSEYKYDVHYGLGDLVELRNDDGLVTNRRVTEQIFVSDTEGDRSYPTLSEASSSAVDTWLYQGDTTWDNTGIDDVWGSH